MPFLDSQHPDQWGSGWKVGGPISPFSYSSTSGVNSFIAVDFPSGVATGTEPIWLDLLDQIVPLIPGGLHTGWCFGYENRANVNNTSMKSLHAYGLALDINAPVNPNGSRKGSAGSGQYQLPPSVAGPISAANCLWGADWGDAMHIELHLSPEEVATYTGASGVHVVGSGKGVSLESDNTSTTNSSSSTDLPFILVGAAVAVIGGAFIIQQL